MKTIPPHVAMAIRALAEPYRSDLTTEDVVRRLMATADPEPAAPRGCSITESARMLGVSRRKVYDLTRRGLLPVVSLGHRTKRVPRAALVALLTPAGTATEVQ